MKDIRVTPELLQALNGLGMDAFTVAELTQTYLELPSSKHQSKKSARQFVYRNMVRMIKAGMMERLPEKGGWPRYRLAESFGISTSQRVSASAPPSPPTAVEQSGKLVASSTTVLKDRLSKHRSDMLCAMGEAEEYSALSTELPVLRGEVQALYNEARERSAILLGKIKALESLLSQQPG